MINPGGVLTPFKEQFFRAGHGHAGVLILVALLYCYFLGNTALPDGLKRVGAWMAVMSTLAVSGGMFLHMAIGEPQSSSAGFLVSAVGALLLTASIVLLLYALVKYPALR